jgi:hypothetical protein
LEAYRKMWELTGKARPRGVAVAHPIQAGAKVVIAKVA